MLTNQRLSGALLVSRDPERAITLPRAEDSKQRANRTHEHHALGTMKTAREEAQKNIAENRKAFHDYHILETFEAGVALLGTEVKSIREGNVNLRDSFARVEGGEVWIYNVHINPYSHRGYADHEPTRRRKLLLHRPGDPQADRQDGRAWDDAGARRACTFSNGYVKVAIGLAKGKKAHDKRETIKRREADRETRAAVKESAESAAEARV